MGIRAWLEFPATRFELDVALRDKVRGHDVPAADDRRAQQLAPALFHKQNPRARRTEHPLLGPRAGEVDMLQRNRSYTHGLNGVDRKQNAAPGTERTDRVQIDAITADIVRAGESDELRSFRQRALDNFRRDFSETRGLEQDGSHTTPFEREPGINIRRIIIEVADDLIAVLPIQTVGDRVQSARGW